jgi:hypothetical protein
MSKSESTIVEGWSERAHPCRWRPKHLRRCRKSTVVRQVRRKLLDNRPGETTERFAIWKIRADGPVRRTVLSRDRLDTGSLVPVPESSARPSRVSQKSTQKCQHEENRSPANARECNRYDHGRSRGRNAHAGSSHPAFRRRPRRSGDKSSSPQASLAERPSPQSVPYAGAIHTHVSCVCQVRVVD